MITLNDLHAYIRELVGVDPEAATQTRIVLRDEEVTNEQTEISLESILSEVTQMAEIWAGLENHGHATPRSPAPEV